MEKSIKFYPNVLFLFGIMLFTNCQRTDDGLTPSIPEVKSGSGTLKCSPNVEKQLRHLLLFQFNDNTSSTVIHQFTEALCALKDSIKQVKDLEWGINFNDVSQHSYTLCFFLTFNSMDDFLFYVNHSAHKRFITTWLNPNIKDLLAFDYLATEFKPDFLKDWSKPLRHLTLINYKDSLSVDAKSNIVGSFTKLSHKIGGLQNAEWGSELLLLGLNKKFDDAFLLTFLRTKDYYQYLSNPLTKNFYDKEVYPNTEDILTIDYFGNK